MNHQNEFLERIRQAEHASLDKVTKFFSGMTIETTQEAAGSKKLTYALPEKIFKPDLFFKTIALAFVLCIFCVFIKEVLFPKSNFSVLGLIAVFAFIVILAYGLIHQFFLNKELNRKIYIDRDKISLGDKTFMWQDIYATAIMTNSSVRVPEKYLVIALKDNTTYEKLQLTNFISPGGFSRKLAQYIEHFKP